MKKKITNEAPFQVLAHSFAVGYSATGYVLNYSADGVNYTAWNDATPANEVCFVTNAPKNCWFKLVGNTGDVTITY